jgi:hypothetical protein
MHVQRLHNDWVNEAWLPSELRTGMALMIDKETKEAVPVTSIPEGRFSWPRTLPRSTTPLAAKFALSSAWRSALMKNYDPSSSPTHFLADWTC